MLEKIEKAIQDDLDRDFPEVSKLRADFTGKAVKHQASVAEQLLDLANTVKTIQQDIDAFQEMVVSRLDALRKRLGSRS